MDKDKYTVTVYAAAPGTPLTQEKEPGATSTPGHMYYTTQKNGEEPQSYGFAPVKHGSMDGPGRVVRDDVANYKDPLYSRTMEVSKDQYDKLNDYGNRPKENGFDTYYKDARNNCVDFTWSALNHANIKRTEIGKDKQSVEKDGPDALRPSHNVDGLKSIKDPVPGSSLNSQHSNPMPKNQSLLQWMLSEEKRGIDDPLHPGNGMYRQAYSGVDSLNAKHGVESSDRDKDFAASIAAGAKAQGLDRVDHVLLSDDGSRTFAVQGNLQSSHGLDRKVAQLQTTEALNTPIAQSSGEWTQHAAQSGLLASRQQAQLQPSIDVQSSQQHAAPTMRLG
ncbi:MULTISPECIES: XVIPCD domain-containing protein [Rhodanobacteraceae]|uniref:XVIPCD domain-containing protein n=1 Tax=Rhodanobacteraceae TaxID=1775411 RepID=UPI0008853675|nr:MULTISPECIES: XVIPCD domain-containing protein [Rhodanobacteraceae]SDG99741.1 hypothetical protein SAMN04515659_3924 [Dyella sp. 333MFSha]SKB96303.1 hypothetical protein SAMN05660880_03484 [Luteibacter sp. 22Crub2.1]